MKLSIPIKQEFVHINDLRPIQIKDVQKALKKLRFYDGELDGISKDLTLLALKEFKEENWLEYPHLIDQVTISKINNKLKTLKVEAKYLIPNLPKNPEHIIKGIIKQTEMLDISLPAQQAYILATVDWETNRTFIPMMEAHWQSDKWRSETLRHYPWVGRGFVPLTTRSNYLLYEELLDIPLVKQPNQALRVDVAIFILVHGIKNGVFTGLKLQDFINEYKRDYINARKVIRGIYKAEEIMELSGRWEDKLNRIKKSEPFL